MPRCDCMTAPDGLFSILGPGGGSVQVMLQGMAIEAFEAGRAEVIGKTEGQSSWGRLNNQQEQLKPLTPY